MFKVAFLFLTVANINHEAYWLDFFSGHQQHYNIYVHAKESLPKTSAFTTHVIPEKAPNKYSQTMRAQIALLKEALSDPDNYKFIFVSGSTLPLCSFNQVYTTVMRSHKSIFEHYPNPYTSDGPTPNSKRVITEIPESLQYKGPQWIILNRHHAQLLVDNAPRYIHLFEQHPSDNEHYPATILAIHGELHNVENYPTTYANWERTIARAYAYYNVTEPFEKVTLHSAINDGYLFARKFHESCNIQALDPYLPYRTTTHGESHV